MQWGKSNLTAVIDHQGGSLKMTRCRWSKSSSTGLEMRQYQNVEKASLVRLHIHISNDTIPFAVRVE